MVAREKSGTCPFLGDIMKYADVDLNIKNNQGETPLDRYDKGPKDLAKKLATWARAQPVSVKTKILKVLDTYSSE
jgi:hypothetical protein